MARQRKALRLNSTSQQVLNLLRIHRRISRSRLAQETGLTRAAMTRVIQPLLECGFVAESGAEPCGVGRPGKLLHIIDNRHAALGISIDSEVRVVVVDSANRVLTQLSLPNRLRDSDPDDPAPLHDVVALCRAAVRETDVVLEGIGICISGNFDASGRILCGNDFASSSQATRLRELLASELNAVVVLEHDCNAGLLTERWLHPELPAHPSLLYVTDRLGFAIMLEGKLYRAPNEWPRWLGDLQVNWRDTQPDISGSLAAVASIESMTDQLAGFAYGTRPPISMETARQAQAELYARYRAGDPFVQNMFKESFIQIAKVVRNLAILFSFDLVTLSGWTTDVLEANLPHVEGILRKEPANPHTQGVVVQPACLEHDQHAVGAALAAVEHWLTAPGRN